MRALGQFLSHTVLLAAVAARRPALPARPRPQRPTQLLHEGDSLALLAAAGVPVAQHRLCRTADEARAALADLGAAEVVVKGCSDQVTHKSDLGLVKLGLASADAVAQAFADVQTAATKAGVPLAGVLVAERVRGRRELMIGARRDPVFGPVVLVGDGGAYVESMPDAQVLLPPFDATRVEQALRRLRIAPLLDGVRGEPALDVAAFCAAAVAVGTLMSSDGQRITQLDINPVIVRARGQGCAAVDAVVIKEVS